MDHTEKEAALASNNIHQVEEALGNDNCYFAGQYYRRAMDPVADKALLILYYIENGGAEGHRRRVERRKAEDLD